MPTISQETFSHLDNGGKLDILYDELTAMQKQTKEAFVRGSKRMEEIENNVSKLENRKIINTGAAGIGGVIGGMIVVWVKKIFME